MSDRLERSSEPAHTDSDPSQQQLAQHGASHPGPALNVKAAAFLPAGSAAIAAEQQQPAKTEDDRSRGAQLAGDKKGSGRSQSHSDAGPTQGAVRGHGRTGRAPNRTAGRSRRGGRDGGLSQAFGHGGDGPPDRVRGSAPTAPAQAAPARGSSMQQANHLLNFQRYDGGRGGLGGRRPRSGARPAPYNRNKFLAANYRFAVSDAAELGAASADPDRPLDWDDVLQVDMQIRGEQLVCPITMGPPVAPQITPCGHVFSFPAIVQHLVTHGGDNFRRTAPCPLCFSQIAARELRLLSARHLKPVKVGDSVEFALLRRPRDSIIPHEVRIPPVAAAAAAAPGSSPAKGSSPRKRHAKPKAEEDGSADVGSPSAAGWRVKRGTEDDSPDTKRNGGDGEGASVCDRFSKFTVVTDAAPLWRRTAEQLARHAAQVTAEGGPDAAVEASYIWIAADLLATRAAGAAERRQRALLATVPPDAAAGMMSPAEAGAVAGRAVRQASTEVSLSATEDADRAMQAAAIAAAFPSLPGADSAANAASAAAGSSEEEAAFTDDEEHPAGNAAGSRDIPHQSELPQGREPQPSSLSSDGAASALAGGSPTTGRGVQAPPAEQYFYQAADGQALFLASLPARIIAAAAPGGVLAAAPPRLSASIVDLEPVTQTAATRRRYRTLSHLPLGASFTLVDVDLAGALPPSALEQFAEDLAAREGKRRQKAAAEAAKSRKEAAVEAAVRAAAAGPTAAELKAMPRPALRRPSAGDAELAATLAESALLAGGDPGAGTEETLEPGSPPPLTGGITFANMARLGYAATGPTLGSSPQTGSAAQSPSSSAVWGGGAVPRPWGPAARSAGGSTAADVPTPWISAIPSGGSQGSNGGAKSATDGPVLRPQVSEGSGKKKGKPVMLFSSGQRRY